VTGLHRNAQRVQSELVARGAGGRVVELPASTRSAAEAAAAIGTEVAKIAKSLVFRAGDAGVLVIASGANRVSVDKVSRLTGTPIARADADDVRRLTGYPIGGVPPLAHTTPLRILIDRDIMEHEEIWAAGGTPRAVFPTTPQELARMTQGELADIKE
jgi:prolyl-tRNA editing enzyme YbaK/EbsC (Cys-tRNA(Pro) deacylase)